MLSKTIAATTAPAPPTTVFGKCSDGDRSPFPASVLAVCLGGVWTTIVDGQVVPATAPAPTSPPGPAFAPAEITAVLDGPATAWALKPSDNTFAAVAAVAHQLIGANRPFPAASDDNDGQYVAHLVNELPTNDPATALDALNEMRVFLPHLPVVLDDGTYTIGQDIQPGKYRGVQSVDGCYWEALSDSGSTIRNDFISSAPQVVITVKKSDYGFHIENCGPLVKIG